jgi:hypothetical protein
MIEKPSIIIGGSLESLLYAWRTQTPVLAKESKYVYRYDKAYSSFDLSFMNAKDPKQFQRNLIFALSFEGLMPYSSNIENIRTRRDIIDVITKGNRKVQFKSEQIIKFDKDAKKYWVYDFFNTRSMTSHEGEDIFDNESDFIREINFYDSTRSFNSKTKDFVASSRMTHEQLLDPDYGIGVSKIKVLRMLKSAGLKGQFSQEYKGKKYYKSPKIELHKRVVSKIYKPLLDFESIYEMKQEEGKAWKTFETLKKRGEIL